MENKPVPLAQNFLLGNLKASSERGSKEQQENMIILTFLTAVGLGRLKDQPAKPLVNEIIDYIKEIIMLRRKIDREKRR